MKSNTSTQAPSSVNDDRVKSNGNPSKVVHPRSSTFKSALSSILGSSSSSSLSSTLSGTSHSPSSTQVHSSPMEISSSQNLQPVLSLEHRRHSTTTLLNNTQAHIDNNFDSPAHHHDSEKSHKASTSNIRSTTDDFIGDYKKRNSVKRANSNKFNLSNFGEQYLKDYLAERGLLSQKLVYFNDNIRISISTSGNHIFLPSNRIHTDQYLARLSGLRRSGSEDIVDTTSSNHRPHSTSGHTLNQTSDGRSSSESLTREVPGRGSSSSKSEDGSSTTQASQSNDQYNSSASFTIDETMSPHSMAMIFSVDKPTTVHDMQIQLSARVRVFWSNGVPPTKSFKEEVYNIGSLNWILDAKNYDLYIPSTVSSKDKIIKNTRGVRSLQLFKSDSSKNRAYMDSVQVKQELLKKIEQSKEREMQPGEYVYIIPVVFAENIPETLYYPSARVGYRLSIAMKSNNIQRSHSTTSLQNQLTGSFKKPDSRTSMDPLTASYGRHDSIHSLESLSSSQKTFGNCLFKKVKSSLHIPTEPEKPKPTKNSIVYVEYPLSVIRTPPLASISTANKPIYVNRVWADSLSYELSFGKKYISLNSTIPIKIKMTPLIKDLRIERVRISIIERVTLVSKDFKYEYDQVDVVAKDPYNAYYQDFQSKRRKDRTIALLEVRGKEKGGRALREEIIDNCVEGNMLAYDTIKNNANREHEVGINDTLTITSQLEFPKYADLDRKSSRFVPPYGIDHYVAEPNLEEESLQAAAHHSNVLGFFSNHSNSCTMTNETPAVEPNPKFHVTNFNTNAEHPVKFHTRLHDAKRGLYLDSLNCSHISSKHKLEVMFRVCKNDPSNPSKTRKFEVLVDIPVFIVSELCTEGNMELPTYSMALVDNLSPNETVVECLPSFEEVISVPGSPIGSPYCSPASSPDILPVHYPDELCIQQLNLTSNNSYTSLKQVGSNMRRSSTFGTTIPAISSTPSQVCKDPKYRNLDKMLSKSPEPDYNKVDLGVPYCLRYGLESESSLFKSGYSLTVNNTEDGLFKKIKLHEVEAQGLDRQFTKSDPPTYEDVFFKVGNPE